MNFFERVAALQRKKQSFAVATVVARRAPVSAHLGDHAIVFADGRMEGFIGGACSREIDPVCGMQVHVATARHTAEVDGVVYYFCGANCRAPFVEQPQDFQNTHP
jgi:YHS domain-containing protein